MSTLGYPTPTTIAPAFRPSVANKSQASEKQWPLAAKRHIFDADARKHMEFRQLAIGAYLTRDELITMTKNGEKFVVIDADTGDDVTSSYHPIIVEH